MLIPALYVAHSVVRERKRDSVDYDVLLVIAPNDLDDSHKTWMAENGVRHIDDLDTSSIVSLPIAEARLSVASLYRLLVPAHLSGQYDRLIYLDADVEVRRPLGLLFSLDLGVFSIAATPAAQLPSMTELSGGSEKPHDSFRKLGMTPPFDYFNSGVLLIGVDLWIRQELGLRALAFLEKNMEICPFIDESAMNAILNGRYLHLSPVWNFRGWTFSVRDAQQCVDPNIVHFDGPIKPWKKFGEARRFSHFRNEHLSYKNFLETTPWQAWLNEQWDLADLVKSIEFEVSIFIKRLLGKRSWQQYSVSEQKVIAEEFARYCNSELFADVEQGIVLSERGVLRSVNPSGPVNQA